MNFEALLEPILAKIRLMVGRCVIIASKYSDGELLTDIELLAGEKRRGVEFSAAQMASAKFTCSSLNRAREGPRSARAKT